MTPLEAMAKAICDYENAHGSQAPVDWDYIRKSPDNINYEWYMGIAKAAILSLAEVELSEEAISQGDAAYYAVAQKKDGDRFSALRDQFRAMLRSIAEGS